ncbi:hypothetical protein PUR61_34960 [Streptomyces sp. BE20]|uniref:hypothetical protein n=1 Tax=unclassified Streptomyces TaxID=2593676 RepID=UPI002E79E59D|nr:MULTISPECIES: hypothetical protein [unclassified Streptomyces]MED7947374.1 hypothetical protein [Streptomyces sp. BE303]MEE1827355.1 hypothetical protein [Streptomyces sp. BE20]
MATRIRPVVSRPTAIYLRCYPCDAVLMLDYWQLLERYSVDSGLGEATLFMDNGRRSTEPLAALAALTRAVEAGVCDTVLIPGPFVFSLDDAVAAATIRRLEEAGGRVVEMARSSHSHGAPVRDVVTVR